MDALTLEQEALKLTPLSRIRLANLLYTSLEVEADREWDRKAIAECESRYQAYKNGCCAISKGSAFQIPLCAILQGRSCRDRHRRFFPPALRSSKVAGTA